MESLIIYLPRNVNNSKFIKRNIPPEIRPAPRFSSIPNIGQLIIHNIAQPYQALSTVGVRLCEMTLLQVLSFYLEEAGHMLPSSRNNDFGIGASS